jgi:DAK2 domain fusion protein YloV
VLKPVEGTMLTVIRAASDGAAAAASTDGATIPAVLAGALRDAEQALARTPEQLEILRQAGVVDAGGQGVVILVHGLARAALGETAPAPALDLRPANLDADFSQAVDDSHAEDAYGYCTNFMVLGEGIDVATARADLAAMGESAVIVGDEAVLKVHIHTTNPGRALDYALRLGELSEIRIDNMELQTRALRAQRAADSARDRSAVRPSVAFGRQAVLAVASGAGLSDALRSMGATGVIDGGETMNPSTQEILAAVEATGVAEVILLPNHPNVIMAANQVRELTERALRVVPTRSVPQGIAALSSFNADAELDTNARSMTSAMAHVHTIQVARASRDATINGVAVREGQAIVLIDGDLVAASDDAGTLVIETLRDERFAEAELITIYTGQTATAEHTAALTGLIEEQFPDADIEVHDGGQPTYSYIISLE